MDAQRARELMDESRELSREAAAETGTSPDTEALLDEEWLMGACEAVYDAIEKAAEQSKSALQAYIVPSWWWMLSDGDYACDGGRYAFYADSHLPEEMACAYVPAPEDASPTDCIPMFDIVGELLEEDGYAINSSEIYGNNALTRFMSKRAQNKNGVRVNYGGEGTDPNLLIYW